METKKKKKRQDRQYYQGMSSQWLKKNKKYKQKGPSAGTAEGHLSLSGLMGDQPNAWMKMSRSFETS